MLEEWVRKSQENCSLLTASLQEALHYSTSCQAIVLLEMVQKAADMNRRVAVLAEAIKADQGRE